MSEARELARGDFKDILLEAYGLPDHVLKKGSFISPETDTNLGRLIVIDPVNGMPSAVGFECGELEVMAGLDGDLAAEMVCIEVTEAFKEVALAYFGSNPKAQEHGVLLNRMKGFHNIIQPTEIVSGAVIDIGTEYITVAQRARNSWKEGKRHPQKVIDMDQLKPNDFITAGINLNTGMPDIVYSRFRIEGVGYTLIMRNK